MKYLVLIGDGMADFPIDDLGGKTPLDVANTPAMDTLSSEGQCALFCPIPQAYPAGSDIGNLSLFGYDPDKTFTGRAPLEAVNQKIKLGNDELVFRCNLTTLTDDTMQDFTAEHISNEEASTLINFLNEKMGNEALHFHCGVGYRHLVTLKTDPSHLDLLTKLTCTPPHDITGQNVAAHLPKGESNDTPIDLMKRTQDLLRDHPINLDRVERGLSPATSIWLWGQGVAPTLETFETLYNITGSVISAVDIVNGIGRSAGLEVVSVEGATGYLDTNYEGKVEASLNALATKDFAYLHIEAPDEASHEGKLDLKLKAIEDFDARVVAPCLAWAREQEACRVLVAPDHITSLKSKTHAQGPVPYALWGTGIEQDETTCYCETEAEKRGTVFEEGHRLVPTMITKKVIA